MSDAIFFNAGNLKRAGLLALGALTLSLIPTLMGHPLAETPETRIAVVAREMVQSGNWEVPTLGGKPRLIKPPLPYWIAASCAKLLGSDGRVDPDLYAKAVQIPSAVFLALTVFLVTLFACGQFGTLHGTIAGVILATCSLPFSAKPFQFALMGYADMGLMFFCAGMFVCAARIWTAERPTALATAGFGVFLGLAILQKWFVPIMLLGLPVAVEFFLCKSRRWTRTLFTAAGFAIAALLILPWLLLLEARLPGGLKLMRKGIRECASAIGHIHKDRWVYYVYVLLGGLLPWTPLLFGAVIFSAAKVHSIKAMYAARPAAVRFFDLVAVLGFVVLYVNIKQQGYYLLPLFPAMAIVGGFVLGELWQSTALVRRLTLFTAIVGVAGSLYFGVDLVKHTRVEEQPLTTLKQRLQEVPPGVEIYIGGIHESKQWHYLGRSYKTLYDLTQESSAPGVQRVLVALRSDIEALKISDHLAPFKGSKDEPIVIAAMEPGADWATLIGAARAKRQKENMEGE